MIIIQCKYTTHYTYNTILYTLYCCYYALHTIHVDQDEMKLELVNIA